jgi:site-specific DNA recombinase
VEAVVYCRVSADDEREGRSVGEQERACREVAEREGWHLDDTAVFVDNDRSASRFATRDRPGFADLLGHLATGRGDVLVLWESSRGSRRLAEWAGLLDLCRERGVQVHVVTHGRTYDLDRSRDWRTLAEDGVDSAYESEKTRDRVLRAVRDNAARGRPHGKLSYGYARRYDERGKFVEQHPVEEQAAVLREAAWRVLAGESCYSVAQDFNRRGLASPGDRVWEGTEVKRLLISPAYIGKRVHRGQIIGDATWPAILTENDHHRLVALLTDPARNTVTDPSVKHLLTGLARCAVCGGGMRPIKNRGYPTYMCRYRFCTAIRVPWIEDAVTRAVLGRLRRPDAADLFAAREADADDRAAAGDELAALNGRLDTFARRAALGEISDVMLAKVEREIAPLIADAQRRARPPRERPALRRFAGKGVDVDAVWAGLNIVARREVVAELVELRVSRGRRGERSLNPARLGESRWVGDTRTWAEIGLV